MIRTAWCCLVAVLVLLPRAAGADDSDKARERFKQGQEAYQKGDFEKAIEDFTEAIRLDPKYADGYFQRGRAYLARKTGDAKENTDKAIADFGEAIKVNPNLAGAYSMRGYVCHEIKKEYERAVKDYQEAIRIDAGSQNARNNLAWLMATCPDAKFRDGAKAVEQATRACELSEWKSPYFIDTLAAANAEAGKFDDAVKWQKKVLELPGFSPAEKEEAQQRLKLYEDKKPYRTPQ
jgi:tetratricopeptide (TPR) repeat protein